MIEYNELIRDDLYDDLEYLGADRKDFSLNILIGKSINKAFAFGYNYDEWRTQLWIPVSIRKRMRHLHEELDKYLPQIKWLNDKLGVTKGKEVNTIDYTNYILDNMFMENDEDTLLFTIGLARVLKNQINNGNMD